MTQPVAILRYYDAVVCGADVVDALSHASILRYYGDVVSGAACSNLSHYGAVVDALSHASIFRYYGDVVDDAACSNLSHYGDVVCGAGAVMRQSCLLRCRSRCP